MKHHRDASQAATPRAARARAPSDGQQHQAPGLASCQDGREQQIRETAYRHYEARGCTDGHALDDWL